MGLHALTVVTRSYALLPLGSVCATSLELTRGMLNIVGASLTEPQ